MAGCRRCPGPCQPWIRRAQPEPPAMGVGAGAAGPEPGHECRRGEVERGQGKAPTASPGFLLPRAQSRGRLATCSGLLAGPCPFKVLSLCLAAPEIQGSPVPARTLAEERSRAAAGCPAHHNRVLSSLHLPKCWALKRPGRRSSGGLASSWVQRIQCQPEMGALWPDLCVSHPSGAL